jgi:DNA repair exonuclease SbcCD ATPase subunit
VRLHSIEISGFRAFPGAVHLDLDADAIVITGNNGTGKTSFFDAVLWGLVGEIPRYGERQDSIISRYSHNGRAEVTIRMKNAERIIEFTRAYDGEVTFRRFSDGKQTLENERADIKLLESTWPEALHENDSSGALAMAFTRGVYLQQDLLRQFIQNDSDQQRFDAVSRLLGIGRLNELRTRLERDRAAWSRACSGRQNELDEAGKRLNELRVRFARLGSGDQLQEQTIEHEWTRWWQQLPNLADRSVAEGTASRPQALVSQELTRWWQQLPNMMDRSAVDSTSSSSHALVDIESALKSLDAARGALERRLAAALRTMEAFSGYVEVEAEGPVEVEPATRRASEVEARLAQLRNRLAEAEAQAAAERRDQVRAREAAAEMKTLAALALRHLGEHCPVCRQTHDVEATREHLRRLSEESTGEGTGTTAPGAAVATIAGEIEQAERELSFARRELRNLEDRARRRAEAESLVRRQIADLGIKGELRDTGQEAKTIYETAGNLLEQVRTHYGRGEKLALQIARVSENAEREWLRKQVLTTEQEKTGLQIVIDEYNETHKKAGLVINALREVSLDAVDNKIQEMEPLLKRIYAKTDPHPTFKDISIITKYYRGQGRLDPAVQDVTLNRPNEDPVPLFSSSQLNAFAFAVFLAMNIGVPALPLDGMMLDDPLQSLDDIHLLGLIDILRRVRHKRQLALSTHDARLTALLERKLRPLEQDERTIVVSIESWTRDGPIITSRDVARSDRELKVIAA